MTLFLFLLAACNPEPAPARLSALPELPPKLGPTAAPPARDPRPFREAVIAFTAEVQGEIEPCGCPTTPYGGFVRRERLFTDARAMGPPLFVVDAGEMLLKGTTAPDPEGRLARAEVVLDLAATTGLDAWAVAPTDLVPGGIGLLELSSALSSNWLGSDGNSALPTSKIVERGGVKLGVVGLSAPVDGLSSRDPVQSVVAAMQGDADAWIVLSNADQATNRLVAGVPGVGMVLTTAGDVLEDPDRSFGAPIIETAARGRFVTFVHLSLGSIPRAVEITEASPFRDVAAARQRGAPDDAAALEKWTLARTGDRLRLEAAAAGHNFAVVKTIPLASDLDSGATEGAAQSRIELFRASSLRRAQASAQKPTDRGFAGAGTCGGCHADRLVQWVYDPHSSAIDSVASRGETRNPECIGCHTTGFGRPGGFSSVEPRAIEPYKGVQCEACHGPMQGHSRRGDRSPEPVTERTCRTCHDPANSPQFDYVAYLSRISCSRIGGGTTDDPANVTPVPKRRTPSN